MKTFIIKENEAGQRFDKYLKKLLKEAPSSFVYKMLRKKNIVLNGKKADGSEKLEAMDEVKLFLADETYDKFAGAEVIVSFPTTALDIVYEDEDILIINKPAGMPIHPSQGNYDNTLANACAWYFKEKDEPFVYRCINRLDRDTTGLLIIARHLYSASLLSAMMARREIHREYLALATGIVPEDGTITAPIARKEGSTIERMVDFKHGEYACTHYRRLSITNTDPVYSLVALKLDTGRTHQIRVHMNYIGHPLPGDFLYNPDYSHISRQALHSHHLRFQHPITGEEMHFTAPVPEDMLL